MVGCNPERKIQKAIQTLKDADRLDDACAENFPVIDSIIKGDTIVKYDTLWGEGEVKTDTVETKDTVYITKILPSKTITKTVTIKDTIIRRDFAYENVLKDEIRDKDKLIAENISTIKLISADRDKFKGRSRKYLWLIIALAVFSFRRQLLTLLKL